jgi:hypothetical protein
MAAHNRMILMLHDTTEFSYQRERPEAIGITKSVNSGRDKEGRVRSHTVCGIMMHSSLAVTTDGVPLGLAAVKFWTRDKFKGTAALKRKINPTRVPIEHKESVRWLENLRQSTALMNEPAQCVHIGDRESDIYEFFCAAQDAVGPGRAGQSSAPAEDPDLLSEQNRQTRRLPRACQRSSSRQHGHVAGSDAALRHSVRRHDRRRNCG